MFARRYITRGLTFRSVVAGKQLQRTMMSSGIKFNQTSQQVQDSPVKPETKAQDSVLSVKELEKMNKIDPAIIKSLQASKFFNLTPVQTKSMIPIFEDDEGMVVRAKTGTGKTLAFVIPTVQTILQDLKDPKYRGKVSTLVIAPTRDLALQIEREYNKILGKFPRQLSLKIGMGILIGGKRSTVDSRNRPQIVIATPGRLMDSLSNPKIAELFSLLKYRVYDEADRILEQGFEDELNAIDGYLKKVHQSSFKSILFSATVDKGVDNFAKDQIGQNYRFINCVEENEAEAHENIFQKLVVTNNIGESFSSALSYIIKSLEKDRFKAIVFLPTITAADWLASSLSAARKDELYDTGLVHGKYRSTIAKLHGKMSQAARDRTVQRFRETKHGVLVCTDVAARGLDFRDVTDVIQMTPSSSVADYIHKIGRTARAGAKGKATTFLAKGDMRYIHALEKERGVTFSETIKADELQEQIEDLFSKIRVDEEVVEDFIRSFLQFQRQVGYSYRLNVASSIANTMEFYRQLVQDPDAKMHGNAQLLQGLIRTDPDMVDKYFTYPASLRPRQGSNNRQSKRNTFASDNYSKRGGSGRFGERSSSYGNSRGYKNYGNNSYNNRGERGDQQYGTREGYKKNYGERKPYMKNDRNDSYNKRGNFGGSGDF